MPKKFTAALVPFSLLVLRVVAGSDFIVRGLPKIEHYQNSWRLAAGLHLPAPMVFGWIPTIMEPLGGALLILGLATRWVGGYFMIEMFITGIISRLVLRGVPFVISGNTPGTGFDIDSMLFAGSFVLLVFGAGAFALDRLLTRRRSVSWSAAGAAAPA